MPTIRSGATAPIRRLAAADLAGVRPRCKYYPSCSEYARRRSSDSAYCAGWSSRAGGCCAATHGATEGSIRSRTSGCSRPRTPATAPDHARPLANIFQPLIDVFEAVLKFIHNSVGVSLGLVDRRADGCDPRALVPLTFKQFHSMQKLQQHMPELKAIQESTRTTSSASSRR